jgi:hypothetical protein
MIAPAVILVSCRGFLKVNLLECYAGIRANAERKKKRPLLLPKAVRAATATADWGSLAMSENREICDFEEEDSLQIDAREIAPLLGLTPERLMAELRAGQVYHTAEEGKQDEDSRMRIVFRYRARMARLIVESDGSMHPEINRTH